MKTNEIEYDKDLVISNLKLVTHIAKRYPTTTLLEFEDRYQEGCIGLIKAAQTFNDSKAKFSTHAYLHISWAINNALKRYNQVSTSTDVVALAMKISKRQLNDLPVEDICGLLKESKRNVNEALKHLNRAVLSFDYELNKDNEDNNKNSEFLLPYNQDFDSKILKEKVINNCSKKNAEVIELYLNDYNVAEICEILDLKRKTVEARIYQVRSKLQKDKELFV